MQTKQKIQIALASLLLLLIPVAVIAQGTGGKKKKKERTEQVVSAKKPAKKPVNTKFRENVQLKRKEPSTEIVKEELPKPTTGIEQDHGWVDLGLPSGVRWATCNVGASSPEEYGYYFAWGENVPKDGYYEENSKTNSMALGDISGNWSYDAAFAVWGNFWRTPSKEDWEELKNNCNWTWTTYGGKKGYKIVGPNGNWLFLPAAGCRSGESLYGASSEGHYWSSTPLDGDLHLAHYMSFNSDSQSVKEYFRKYGQSIRPVSINKQNIMQSLENKEIVKTELSPTKKNNTMEEDHEWVDLGLPSGVKWATCNVGASTPWDYGDYFAWGETSTKSTYTKENCKTYERNMDDISGNPNYDAARANWGGKWRLPTEGECKEIVNKCKWYWTTLGGKKGYKVVGLNGNSIFLPAAGYRDGTSLSSAGTYGRYWSSTPKLFDAQSACSLSFVDGYQGVYWGYRGNGRSVRPVTE